MTDRVVSGQFHASEGAGAWRVLPEGACAFFRTGSFAVSTAFVQAISALGLSIIPGAMDRNEIMPFWRSVLGCEPRPDSPGEDLVGPHARLAPLWFE